MLDGLVGWLWNRDEGRPRALVRIALQAVVMVLLSLAVFGVSRVVPIPSAHVRTIAFYGAWTVAVIVAVWLGCRVLDRRALSDLGLRVDLPWCADAAFGVALGGAMMGAILGAELSFGWARYEARSLDAARLVSVLVTLEVFVAVSIVEELVSRGYHLTNLAEGLAGRFLSPAAAIGLATLLSSVVFGVAHADNPNATLVSTGNIVLAGGLLAAGYVLTGRLAIPLGLHLSWNFFQNLFGMPVSGQDRFFHGALLEREPSGPAWLTGGAFGPEAGATGLAAMLAGTLAIVAWVRLREGTVRLDARIAEPPQGVRATMAEGPP